jgi:hypothetical protein
MSDPVWPGEITVQAHFRKHLGPRFMSAGVTIQFHTSKTPGVHFKTTVDEEYKESIVKGIRDGVSIRFPGLLETRCIWITDVIEDPVESSNRAFYLAARCAVEQAYTLVEREDPRSMNEKLYKSVDIWQRRENAVARYRCFHILPDNLYSVQSVDFYRPPFGDQAVIEFDKRFLDLFVEEAPESRSKGYSSLAEAIAAFDREFGNAG